MAIGWTALADTLFGLAHDAVLIQRRLDEANAEQRARFVQTLAAVPEPARAALLPLAPPAIAVNQHRVRCDLRVTRQRGASVQIIARPINAGFSWLSDVSETERSTMAIEVRRAPVQAPSARPTEEPE